MMFSRPYCSAAHVVQPPILFSRPCCSAGHIVGAHIDNQEYLECEAAVKAHPPFQEAMRRRGVDDMDQVLVDVCLHYPIFAPLPVPAPAAGQSMAVIKCDDREVIPLPPPFLFLAFTPFSLLFTLTPSQTHSDHGSDQVRGQGGHPAAPTGPTAHLHTSGCQDVCSSLPLSLLPLLPLQSMAVIKCESMAVIKCEVREVIPLPPPDPLRIYTPVDVRIDQVRGQGGHPAAPTGPTAHLHTSGCQDVCSSLPLSLLPLLPLQSMAVIKCEDREVIPLPPPVLFLALTPFPFPPFLTLSSEHGSDQVRGQGGHPAAPARPTAHLHTSGCQVVCSSLPLYLLPLLPLQSMAVIKCEVREVIPLPPPVLFLALTPFPFPPFLTLSSEHGSDQVRVIKCEDREVIPLPPPDPLRNYTPGADRGGVDRSDLKPIKIEQPEGPSFRVNGYAVEWQKVRGNGGMRVGGDTGSVAGVDRCDLKPIRIEQLEGPSSRVIGYAVEWQKVSGQASTPPIQSPWSFRVGFTPKEGLVLHSLSYDDGSSGRRGIAHRLSFCEMVVPYGDPHEPHYRKNAFDASEDGLGRNAHSLKKGCDCLGFIRYFDAHMSNFIGGVETIENAVCMHEEDHGMLWKHVDWRSGHAEVRRSRRLVLSLLCTIGNYDYGFFWYLYQVRVLPTGLLCKVRVCLPRELCAGLALSVLTQSHSLTGGGGFVGRLDGKIEAQIKLTGILSVGALREGEERRYGTLLVSRLYAPIHQHFFVARMDMAVDCRPGEAANQVSGEMGYTVRGAVLNAPGLICVRPSIHQHFFVARMDMAVDCRPGEAANQVSGEMGYTVRGAVLNAPGLICVRPSIHQHFFVARMDMAVDCRPGEAANQVSGEMGYTVRGAVLNAPGLICVRPSIHQHFFVARMDMAVDCRPGEQANQVRALGGYMARQGVWLLHEMPLVLALSAAIHPSTSTSSWLAWTWLWTAAQGSRPIRGAGKVNQMVQVHVRMEGEGLHNPRAHAAMCPQFTLLPFPPLLPTLVSNGQNRVDRITDRTVLMEVRPPQPTCPLLTHAAMCPLFTLLPFPPLLPTLVSNGQNRVDGITDRTVLMEVRPPQPTCPLLTHAAMCPQFTLVPFPPLLPTLVSNGQNRVDGSSES
ncbi:unnamed protein product [Closterium sp. Naga37s-1]|nr:unnamed protein product [Closterium sp. Naga37s-1]